MNHIKHPECNGALTAQPGTEERVDTLHVQHGLIEGVMVVRSFWQPTPEELARLNAGGCVALTVWGDTHAPLRLDALDIA